MYSVGETYARALHRVGATPVILPPIMQAQDCELLLLRLDGLLLSGGEDVSPGYYGEAPAAWMGGVDAERDTAEMLLVQAALGQNKPLFAICRGHQVLNVALGGTLYQDIAAQLPNTLDHAYVPARPMEQLVHSVTLASDSRLAAILGGVEFKVNSAHHQSLREPGAGMRIVAHAPDGVVEATELPDYPFCLSVQWHPEAMVKTDDAMLPLFAAFVAAAGA